MRSELDDIERLRRAPVLISRYDLPMAQIPPLALEWLCDLAEAEVRRQLVD